MRKLALLVADLITFYSALALILVVRYGTSGLANQWAAHVVPFSAISVLWILSFYVANLYDERILRNSGDFFGRLAQAVLTSGVLSVLFFYLIPYFGITPRVNLFLFIVVAAALSVGMRAMANRVLVSTTKKRLLIVGLSDESRELASYIARHPQLGWEVSAIVRLGQDMLYTQSSDVTWPLLDESTNLADYISEHRINTVVIGPRAYGRSDMVAMLYTMIGGEVDFASLASFSEEMTGRIPLGAIDHQWFLDNIDEHSKRGYEVIKRAMDIVAAVLLGVPTLLMTPFIIAAIMIESPGNPFFSQQRSGFRGRPFRLFKFRSMILNAESATGAVWSTVGDTRITRVGRFLRRTRLDELPQVLNLIRGDLSLVGPRAERPEFDAQLTAQVPFYRERYLIKPGLTGWAQINPPYYYASVQDAIFRFEYDLYYIKRRSLALDLGIILRTITIVLRREGR